MREEKKVSYEGELNKKKLKNYNERMENILSNNQIYDNFRAFVESDEKNDEFEFSIWLAKGDNWALERKRITIQHDEDISDMRPKLFNIILGRLRYTYENTLSSDTRDSLKFCAIDVLNYLKKHFKDPHTLLYLFNMSRGLADKEEHIRNFRKALFLAQYLSEADLTNKEAPTELKDLQTMASYFYKLILETPLVYNAIGRLFTEEVNRDNGYHYDFNADNTGHLDKVLCHYRAIKVVITGKTVPFYGMVGRDNEVYINVDKLANGNRKIVKTTQKVAYVMQVMFHSATHSAIRQESPQGYAGYTHSHSVYIAAAGDGNENKKVEEMNNLEGGYRFEKYVFGAHDRNFAENEEFAKKMLLRESYMKAVKGSESRLFSVEEASDLVEIKHNYDFSGIRCGIPDLGRLDYR